MLRMRASASGASRTGDVLGSEVRLRWVLPVGTDAEAGVFFRKAFVSDTPLIHRAVFQMVDRIGQAGS
jgi:hypothetical protein